MTYIWAWAATPQAVTVDTLGASPPSIAKEDA